MRVSGKWTPTAVAALLGGAMIWLAGDPLGAPSETAGRAGRARPAGTAGRLVLHGPLGELDAFPSDFAWSAVPGADAYEIYVSPARDDAAALFRQRGPRNGLHVEFDAGAEPPPGDYVWEVRALRGVDTLAFASGRFRVRAAP